MSDNSNGRNHDFTALVRIPTPAIEASPYHGGILQYVLRQLLNKLVGPVLSEQIAEAGTSDPVLTACPSAARLVANRGQLDR